MPTADLKPQSRRVRKTVSKQARLYYFDAATVERIEHLAQVFGGKEKGISAAIGIVSQLLRGQPADVRISQRSRT